MLYGWERIGSNSGRRKNRRKAYIDGIEEIARKNMPETELKRIPGNWRDWRKWIEGAPTLRSIRNGERRR